VDGDCFEGTHCLLDSFTCVGCLRNAHCLESQTCDPAAHLCLDGFLDCASCQDADCLPGSQCLDTAVGDTGCVRTCLDDTDCNQGFRCATSGTLSHLCLPAYIPERGTCAAIRDIGEDCSTGGLDTCGLSGVQDALCASGGGLSGVCAIPCLEGSKDSCPLVAPVCQWIEQVGANLCVPKGTP
jgi:hypothetical protein